MSTFSDDNISIDKIQILWYNRSVNINIKTKLEQLGFSTNEIKVYLALLEIGQTSAGSVIKKTRLHRSVVYETLEKLISRKLVFKLTKKKIAYYQPTDPSKILEYAKTQERIAHELVPQLKDIAAEGLPEINVYEGIEAYKNFWLAAMNNLPEGTIDYVAGSIGKKWAEYLGDDLENFLKTRIKRKIKWKIIVFEEETLEMDLWKKYPHLQEFRFLNRKCEKYGNFNVFGEESLILHSVVEPMIIEIKNKTLVKVFKNLFDILWEAGTKR